MRELIQQFTNHPEQDKRGRRRYRDSVHWGAVAKVCICTVYMGVCMYRACMYICMYHSVCTILSVVCVSTVVVYVYIVYICASPLSAL